MLKPLRIFFFTIFIGSGIWLFFKTDHFALGLTLLVLGALYAYLLPPAVK
jgi:hypothetical protein